MRLHRTFTLGLTMGLALAAWPLAASAQFLVVGNDEKVTWNEKGAVVLSAPGRDTVTLVDIKDPAAPRVAVSLPLQNSVFGPPTNLAVTPDNRLALVANSVEAYEDGGWKTRPDNKVYIIDLTTNPPSQIGTVEVGKQPSGMGINRAGDMALVTNRADNSISVLSIRGKEVKVTDTIAMGDQVTAVNFTPDGKRAVAAKFTTHKVALLEIDGGKVTYNRYDIPVGLWPYNLVIAGGGRIAVTADNGASGSSDGHVDTLTIIDLQASPPRAVDKVVVGDAPEGIAVSPDGNLVAAILLNGSAGVAKDAWFATKNGKVVTYRVNGTKLTRTGEVLVGGLPEGAGFSPDGKWLYVGNYVERDLVVLRVEGDKVVDTKRNMKLPGQPAALRSSIQ